MNITIPSIPKTADIYHPQPLSYALAESALTAYERGNTVLEAFAGIGLAGINICLLDDKADVTITDASDESLSVARKIARQLKVSPKITKDDAFANCDQNSFDLIIAAPPAIPTPEPGFWGLSDGMEFATNGGNDGNDYIIKTIMAARECLKETGTLLITIPHWCEHKQAFRKLQKYFRSVNTVKSLDNPFFPCPSTKTELYRRRKSLVDRLLASQECEIWLDKYNNLISKVSIVEAQGPNR